MAASSAPKDPTDDLHEQALAEFPDDGGVSDQGVPPNDCQESLDDLLEPVDAADDLRLLTADGPPVSGRHVTGKYVYSFSFAHPGPKSMARGLCSPSDISKSETMERVQKAYAACGVDLQELAQEGDAESARVFGIGMDLEANLVGRFCAFRDTVLRNCSKRGSKKVANRGGDCGDCGDCTLLGRFLERSSE
jgi:hypothetical protein